MSQPILTLDSVHKSFGGFAAVQDLSFQLEQGEIFGFLGPNGAGKTTTLRMILDIIQPSGGSISILGASSAIDVRQRIGYLPEERGLYRKMRAADTIAYFARLRGVPNRQAKRGAMELLSRFGLEPFARAKNETLSKGMAQKVQLLSTIAHDPEFLILDEPFSGLDPINQKTLEDLILSLREEGRTIIFSTHVMEHAERLCDRFLIMARGRKRFEGTLEEARAKLPQRIVMGIVGSAAALEACPGVAQVTPHQNGGEKEDEAAARLYDVDLAPGGDPQIILKAALAAGLRVTKFEQGGARLHDIFVATAGDKATRGDAQEDKETGAAA